MMKNLAVIYDDFHLKHSPPFTHAERPDRTSYSFKYLNEKKIFNSVDLIKPRKASEEDILRVHKQELYDFILDSIKKNKVLLDPDTYIVNASFEAALLSAGAVLDAVDLVMNNTYKNIFSMMRPPGHHAETGRAMGFCLFNNVAAAAQYAIEKYNINRIAVIDWDVHHGNGTQEIFYNTSKVFFISLHQYPLYPGTGAENEKGAKEGEGYTLNFPLPAGTTGETYLRIFNNEILETLEKYNPQLIFISAGFDAHKDDPLANMKLTEDDYAGMTEVLKSYTDSKGLNIISVLEGGYNLDALSNSIYAHLEVLNK
ncbi:MAG: histone deacetylase [Ignavibacteriales bacterium]|nr:MAG: histone deacetylase [Ignavibacteriales bacterium]